MMKLKFSSRKGSSFVIFALSLVAILTCSSLVADIGMMTFHRARLSNAVDSSTLAGAQELIYHSYNVFHTVNEYVQKNGYGSADIDIAIEDNNTAIRVSAEYEVPFTFGRILGIESKPIHVTSKGKVLPIIGLRGGVRPFAIVDQELRFGETYVLKEGGGDGSNGNYGPIELGGNGAKVYYNNIVYGYDGRLMVGDYITTEPGNMSGPTEDGIDELIGQCTHVPRCTYDRFTPGCPRIITVVVVDTLDVNGRSDVLIVGFASFFLEGVGGSGNDSEIYGTFIKTVTAGEMAESQSDYGLYGVKLSN